MDTNWQGQPQSPAPFAVRKESTLKLSLETRYQGDVMVVYCQGRIVYRDEAAALSRIVGDVMSQTRKLVLDLSGVSSIDSAGIGELALLYTWSQRQKAEFKVAGPNNLVRTLLGLTNLDSVLEIHSSVDNALEAFHEDGVCADC
ncbi:MAG TPA: STAS domain-containing protein [Candidatus Sulfotelmatobacter sp.]|nr:STAS domain-containing protein [Candidatus Sulfotelmatobacter sp.]